jgi:hypothetical protein
MITGRVPVIRKITCATENQIWLFLFIIWLMFYVQSCSIDKRFDILEKQMALEHRITELEASLETSRKTTNKLSKVIKAIEKVREDKGAKR